MSTLPEETVLDVEQFRLVVAVAADGQYCTFHKWDDHHLNRYRNDIPNLYSFHDDDVGCGRRIEMIQPMDIKGWCTNRLYSEREHYRLVFDAVMCGRRTTRMKR